MSNELSRVCRGKVLLEPKFLVEGVDGSGLHPWIELNKKPDTNNVKSSESSDTPDTTENGDTATGKEKKIGGDTIVGIDDANLPGSGSSDDPLGTDKETPVSAIGKEMNGNEDVQSGDKDM